MRFLLLMSMGLLSLTASVLCQEVATPTEVSETNEVPAVGVIAQAQPIQEPTQTEDKKISKRSHGWGHWGWPEYSYGWPWPGWDYGWGHGHGYGGWGGYGGYKGGWHGGWSGGHGWPWKYYHHGYGGHGWHGK